MSNIDSKRPATANPQKYTTGFILSVILTLVPFWIVMQDLAEGWTLVLLLMMFAVAQLFIQLVYFLHLGDEQKPKWQQTSFVFAMFFVVVLVIGSIWIMYELDYNAHPMNQNPQELENTLINDENYKR